MTGLFLINLDAEDELASWRAGVPHRPGRARAGASAARERARGRVARWLRRRGERVVGDGAAPPGAAGRAWMPTPTALAALAAHGATPDPAPTVEALVRANARETARRLGCPPDLALPGGATVDGVEALRAALERPGIARAPGSARAPAWLVRPSLSSAGRARLVVDAGAERDPRTEAFARRHLPSGPLDVAPLVDVEAEYALHGFLAPDGDLAVGRPLVQSAAGGAWRSARADPAATESVRAPLERALRAAADSLLRAGYFGPFGIDALLWRDGDGRARLHAPLEINARYSMAWPRSGLAPIACGAG